MIQAYIDRRRRRWLRPSQIAAEKKLAAEVLAEHKAAIALQRLRDSPAQMADPIPASLLPLARDAVAASKEDAEHPPDPREWAERLAKDLAQDSGGLG